jgi:hypothetical protein
MQAPENYLEKCRAAATRFDARQFDAPWLAAVIILLGVAARIAEYAHYRVLWLDEALTGVTIVSKSFGDFFGPLGLYQIVPPGFLIAAKTSTVLFGVNEYAVRLPALIVGVIAVPVFYLLARRVTLPISALIATAFFATAGLLIYYSGECKPYMGDALFAMILLWIAVRVERHGYTARSVLTLGIAGAVIVWLSFPACFILAGIGLTHLGTALRRLKPLRIVPMIPAYLLWAASFGLLYVLILAPGMQQESAFRGEALMDTMQKNWSFGFPPFPPRNTGDLQLYKDQFLRLFYTPGGFRLTGLAAFAWFVGLVSFYRTSRHLFWLLLWPFAVTLAVSLARFYPFDGRMLLFLTPALFLLIGEGVGALIVALRGRLVLAGFVLLALLLLPPTGRAAKTILIAPERTELDTSLAWIQDQWEEGDTLYLTFYDDLSYTFCKAWFDFPQDNTLREEVPFEKQRADLYEFERNLPALRKAGTVWIPIGHHRKLETFLQLANRYGTITDEFHHGGTHAYGYQFPPTSEF